MRTSRLQPLLAERLQTLRQLRLSSRAPPQEAPPQAQDAGDRCDVADPLKTLVSAEPPVTAALRHHVYAFDVGRQFGPKDGLRVTEQLSFPDGDGPSVTCPRPESHAISSRRVPDELRGEFAYGNLFPNADGSIVRFSITSAKVMGGKRIAEFPNSTAFDLGGRAFVVPRAVPPYENTIDPKAGIFNSPSGYISHLPMLEERADGTYDFHGWMLESIPDELVFEDPRISIVYRESGEPYILLSFTEVLPKEGQIRNRAVVLEIGEDGTPRMPEPSQEDLEAASVLAIGRLTSAHPPEVLGEELERLTRALVRPDAANAQRSSALGWKLGELTLGKMASQLSSLALAMPRGSAVEDRIRLLREASPASPSAVVEALAAALGKVRLPQRVNFSPSGIDAKNGTVDENEAGEIVLRTRMRGFPLCPGYAEQVWVFKDWSHFIEYQSSWNGWEQALEEGQRSGGPIAQVAGQVRPLRAQIIATEETFPELYPHDLLSRGEPAEEGGPEKHFRGFGPGTRPVRFERQGDDLFFSGSRHDELHWAGEIPANLRHGFPIPAGEVRRLTFDHQLRALDVPVYRTGRDERGKAIELEGAAVPRRIYTGCVKLLNASGDKIELLYCDMVQPLNATARGGGIADLEHVYPEGWRVKQGTSEAPPSHPAGAAAEEDRFARARAKGPASLLVYQGEADASTGILEYNPTQLLGEMGSESPRRAGAPGEQQVGPPLEVRVPLTAH